jgi:hypothetical protein
MDTGEEYYIHLHGEQKGPFTLSQIKHMYDRNFIPEEALYWNDGMEQWRHVSDLCGPPKWLAKKGRWLKPATAVAVFAILAVLAILFLPVTIDAWKEANQRDFTREAAYWKARDYVRRGLRDSVEYVKFDRFEEADARLVGRTGATVELSGETVTGKSVTVRSWSVTLHYVPKTREWIGLKAVESPQSQ